MGVFKKLKDVLFDTEEEEIPVITKEEPKKEVVKEEKKEKPHYVKENTITEIKIPKEEIPERELIKSESTFNFPIEVEERPRRSTSRSFDGLAEGTSPRRRETQDFSRLLAEEPKTEKAKPFKSSPIISPVYGVLDQNYSKDDVIIKTDIGVKGPDLDDVRKKAYGIKNDKKKTDEDIFEDPLRTLDEILMEEEREQAKAEAKLAETAEIDIAPIEEAITEEIEVVEKEEFEDTIKIPLTGELTEEIPVVEEYEEEIQIAPEEITEELPTIDEDPVIENTISNTETDLFNLIDSMYDDKESEEE